MLRLRKFRTKNPNKIIKAHLNINTVKNKFEMLLLLFHGVIVILLISKTKMDDSFPTEQFIIEGYSTIYWLDRNDRGAGILLVVKENLLSTGLDKYCFPNGIEIFCIELNLRKKKWLFFCCYNPHKHLLKHHLFQIVSRLTFTLIHMKT